MLDVLHAKLHHKSRFLENATNTGQMQLSPLHFTFSTMQPNTMYVNVAIV